MTNNVIRMTATFVTGALVGLSFGLLIAPAKGSKIRAMIGRRAKGTADLVSQKLSFDQSKILAKKKDKDHFEHLGI